MYQDYDMEVHSQQIKLCQIPTNVKVRIKNMISTIGEKVNEHKLILQTHRKAQVVYIQKNKKNINKDLYYEAEKTIQQIFDKYYSKILTVERKKVYQLNNTIKAV